MAAKAIYWPELSSHGSGVRDIALEVFHDAEADGMLKENNNHTFEGYDPATLFREFAVECIELAQTSSSPEKHKLYLKMASVWHQMAQRWENKQWPSPWYSSDRARDRVRSWP